MELFRVKVSGRSVREQFASLQTVHLLYLEGLRVELNSLRDVTCPEIHSATTRIRAVGIGQRDKQAHASHPISLSIRLTLLECLVGPRPERHAGRRNDRIEI